MPQVEGAGDGGGAGSASKMVASLLTGSGGCDDGGLPAEDRPKGNKQGSVGLKEVDNKAWQRPGQRAETSTYQSDESKCAAVDKKPKGYCSSKKKSGRGSKVSKSDK